MADTNPGPAITSNANSVAGYIPVNTQTNSSPVLSNAIRLIAEYRGVNAAAGGDYPMPVINSSRFVPTSIWYAVNASTTVAASAAYFSAASIGVYSATNAGGTPALVTGVAGPTLGASLTSVTTGTVIGTTAVTASIIYFHVATTAATNAYFDVFLFGADLS
jgi:hypothetical protein